MIALTPYFITAFFYSPLFHPLFELAEELGYDREVLQEVYAWQHKDTIHNTLSVWCLSGLVIMLLYDLQPIEGLNVQDTTDMHRTAALPPIVFPLTSLSTCPEVPQQLNLCFSSCALPLT